MISRLRIAYLIKSMQKREQIIKIFQEKKCSETFGPVTKKGLKT